MLFSERVKAVTRPRTTCGGVHLQAVCFAASPAELAEGLFPPRRFCCSARHQRLPQAACWVLACTRVVQHG